MQTKKNSLNQKDLSYFSWLGLKDVFQTFETNLSCEDIEQIRKLLDDAGDEKHHKLVN